MSLAGWRHVSASVIGSSHQNLGGVCQDSNACAVVSGLADGDALIAVVADGAGSASQADVGSSLACDSVRNSAARILTGCRIGQITKEVVEEWILDFQKAIAEKARLSGLTSRDYACTLLASIIGFDHAVFFQIGDGSIVVSDTEESRYGYVFWPARGEYENTTFFATDPEFARNLQFENVGRHIVELAMFSDGLQRLALDFARTMPHEPFFRGLFPPVRSMSPLDGERLSQSLRDFLSSPRVNERTDDDKTLILATRVLPGVAPHG